MKVRHGFVSNSSSSSFAVIVLEEAYERVIKDLDKDAQKLIKHWAKKEKIGKEKVVCFSNQSDQGGMSTMFSPDCDDELNDFQEYIEEKHDGDYSEVFYTDFLEKLGKEDYLEVRGDM